MQECTEITLLKALIATETEAAYRGMYGLASGVLRHHFIASYMARMERRYDQLERFVGSSRAAHYFVEVMDQNVPQTSSVPLFEEPQEPD